MAEEIVKIVHNPVTAKLITERRDVRLLVSEILSYKVAGAEHMKIKNWDGVSSFYDLRTHKFPAGFVRLVSKRLMRAGYRVRVVSAPAPVPAGPEMPVVDLLPEDPRYDYQPEVMRRLVMLKSMIAQVATGGGKSRIFKLCSERLQLPTLFVTTRKSLMYQMMEGYETVPGRRAIGIMGDDQWNPAPQGVNFATVGTLISRLEVPDVEREIEKAILAHQAKVSEAVQRVLQAKGLPTNLTLMSAMPEELRVRVERVRASVERRMPLDRDALAREVQRKAKQQLARRKETLEILRNVGFLCLEEAHEVGSDSFYSIAEACSNAHYRLALTATPNMRDSEEANMRLVAATGPIGIKVTEKMLIDRGILARPYFHFASTPRPKRLARGTPWQTAYGVGIVDNEARNQHIVEEVRRAVSYGLTAMVLVQQSRHGKQLEDMLTRAGVRTAFIFGEHSQKERKKALDGLASGLLDCVIGSTILDVGVDVPSVGLIVKAGGGKAEVADRQRIGRGLRAKKSGPNVAFILDFTDEHNRHLHRHALERRRIVEETPGFAENIVDRFDYEAFGFCKVA